MNHSHPPRNKDADVTHREGTQRCSTSNGIHEIASDTQQVWCVSL